MLGFDASNPALKASIYGEEETKKKTLQMRSKSHLHIRTTNLDHCHKYIIFPQDISDLNENQMNIKT